MAAECAPSTAPPLVRRTEPRRRMVKVQIDVPDPRRIEVGHCVELARLEQGWNLDEFAQRIGKDPRQAHKYETGELRPPLDEFRTLPRFFIAFVVHLAGLSPLAHIDTSITIRRSA